MTKQTIAHWYDAGNNLELVKIGDNKFILKTNGRVQDARQWMGVEDAAEIWQDAAYQDGPKPTFELTERNVSSADADQIVSAYETSSYPEDWQIETCVFGDCGLRATVVDAGGRVLRIAEKYQGR